MKKVLLFGLTLLFAGCTSFQGAAFSGEVITDYDDMTGVKTTQVYLNKNSFMKSSSELFVLRMGEHKEFKNYYICFSLDANSWWFVDTLLIKVGNNEPILLKSISKDTDVRYGGRISEWVVFKASLEMFQTAATAENIRVRVIGSKHREDYEITPEDQIRIKRLLEAI